VSDVELATYDFGGSGGAEVDRGCHWTNPVPVIVTDVPPAAAPVVRADLAVTVGAPAPPCS
jgi:hypothetical protein